MPDEDLPFKVVRTNSHDEVIAAPRTFWLAGPRMHGG